MGITSLSGELEAVKAEMEEFQAREDSLSARRDSSWGALHQQSHELEQLNSDSSAVTSLVDLTAQEISHLREEWQALLQRSEELKAMI
ncbi:hypothetical protein AMTR_s00082p00092050 [Amborella trichopoda]|uniref:Uncharacterized protein n=1 Tax=Amborella trichopoda TaxID=13333 RepID=W1NSS4_AMBTC|nr:hypothetical protein AMTR_s00082p00092050 [Amborella trichopoda]